MDEKEQEARFQEWLAQYRGILVKVARSFVSAPEDFDDLFQEILLQVWKSIPSFGKRSSESTWIYRVALNRAIVWKRKERRRSDVIHLLGSDVIEANRNENSSTERIDLLYEAIRKLEKVERAVVLLALDGLSYREIAEIVEISESNVGVRLNRIKRKLLKFMKGEQYGIRGYQENVGHSAG